MPSTCWPRQCGWKWGKTCDQDGFKNNTTTQHHSSPNHGRRGWCQRLERGGFSTVNIGPWTQYRQVVFETWWSILKTLWARSSIAEPFPHKISSPSNGHSTALPNMPYLRQWKFVPGLLMAFVQGIAIALGSCMDSKILPKQNNGPRDVRRKRTKQSPPRPQLLSTNSWRRIEANTRAKTSRITTPY